jgi:predicted GIY-YIG superfamily endonuclease
MPWLYILECSDGSYYTGTTSNPEKRLEEHQLGIAECYTFERRPLGLVFTEECRSWPEAIEREIQIKKWSRKKKEALIKKDWGSLKELAKRRSKENVAHDERIESMK